MNGAPSAIIILASLPLAVLSTCVPLVAPVRAPARAPAPAIVPIQASTEAFDRRWHGTVEPPVRVRIIPIVKPDPVASPVEPAAPSVQPIATLPPPQVPEPRRTPRKPALREKQALPPNMTQNVNMSLCQKHGMKTQHYLKHGNWPSWRCVR